MRRLIESKSAPPAGYINVQMTKDASSLPTSSSRRPTNRACSCALDCHPGTTESIAQPDSGERDRLVGVFEDRGIEVGGNVRHGLERQAGVRREREHVGVGKAIEELPLGVRGVVRSAERAAAVALHPFELEGREHLCGRRRLVDGGRDPGEQLDELVERVDVLARQQVPLDADAEPRESVLGDEVDGRGSVGIHGLVVERTEQLARALVEGAHGDDGFQTQFSSLDDHELERVAVVVELGPVAVVGEERSCRLGAIEEGLEPLLVERRRRERNAPRAALHGLGALAGRRVVVRACGEDQQRDEAQCHTPLREDEGHASRG